MPISKNENFILSCVLEKPRTYGQIVEITGKNASQVESCVYYLKRRGVPIRTRALKLRPTGHADKLNVYDLLRIAGQTVAYFDWQEEAVGDLIGINITRPLTRYEKTSLSNRLRNILPEKSIERAKEYY